MRLKDLLNGERVYPGCVSYSCRRMSATTQEYSTSKRNQAGRIRIPSLPSLNIDDKTLKDIIKRLYFPDSPYEFSVLPAEILGQIYEQFLGKVIRLTEGHQAVVEDKPEVKKAGGVKYTPVYIVEYIVQNTLGAAAERKDAAGGWSQSAF